MTQTKRRSRTGKATPARGKRRPRTTAKAAEKTAGRSAPTSDAEERLTSLIEANRQLKRKIFDLYTVFEISRNFNAVLDYQTLLDSFILTCLAQVSVTKGGVFLTEKGQADRYVLAKSKGSGRMPGPGLYFSAHSRLVEYLTRLNRPVVTAELIEDYANRDERIILKMFHPGLAVPLIHQTQLKGLLVLSDKISGREFTLDDVEFLSILGNQIAVAIENARLYEAERKATEQVRATQQQLVQSERLAALGEMSAKVAHEINNPLGIIKNYLMLIRRSTTGNVEARNYTDVVNQEISRIARIVTELLNFDRPNGMTYQLTDVAAVIDDILRLMEQKCDRQKIRLVRHFAPDCPKVNAAPEHLKQVFLNLVINACDAMPDGGELEMTVKPDAGYVLIRFCDTGPGIPADVSPHVFEPFFTTKEPGQGTGLGLSVCYGSITKHGGTITYRNTERGACFEITLPVNGR
jgi:signal transduction histidine kinase